MKAAEAAITKNTVVMIGSAPNFPYGTIDPIGDSELARTRGIGSTDSCLGGFLLPWAEKLGFIRVAVRFSGTGRHLDVLRYAQVQLRREARPSCVYRRRIAPSTSISTSDFRRSLPLPHFAGSRRRAQRGVLGVVGNDG